MEITRTPRNYRSQRRHLELSDLNDDVLFEILLQFVAVDCDGGPFTLVLVCTKWQELALSKPRLWTWMLVDESQPDWKERMEVAAYLSRGLPLQIHLRLPFTTDISISHIVRRCHILTVEPRRRYPYSHHYRPPRWHSETILEYYSPREREQFKHANDDIMRFIADAPAEQIKIFGADPDRRCIMYSAWEIYERIISGTPVTTLLQMTHPFMLTALVFKHGKKTEPARVHFELGEVWAILPTLPHLGHLELYDSFVSLDRKTILPSIRLPSLCTLTVDCPMSHWVFFSFANDVWLGLLTILNSLEAPIIESMTLHSSMQRIKAAMMKARTRPSYLTLSISTFDEGEDEPGFDQEWVWKGLIRAIINLPETTKAFSRLTMPDGLISTMSSLLSLLPKGTSKGFRGGGELDDIARSYTQGIENFDLFYTHRRPLEYILQAKSVNSLTLKTLADKIHEPLRPPYASQPLYAQWLKSVEYIFLEDHRSVRRCLDAYLFHVVNPALKSWDSDHYGWIYNEEILSTRRGGFSFLTTLRSKESVASRLLERFDTPSLHSITLVYDEDEAGHLWILPETLLKHASQLKQPKILGMEDTPDWSRLFDFLNKFQTSGREISTIKLPGLPHPSIVRLLVDALRGGSPVHPTWAELREVYEKKRSIDRDLCFDCFMNGFSCYDDECKRFLPAKMVSITKDTLVSDYIVGTLHSGI